MNTEKLTIIKEEKEIVCLSCASGKVENTLLQNNDTKLFKPGRGYFTREYLKRNTLTPYYLYILSDEKPEDGDYVIPNNPLYGNHPWVYKEAPCPMPYWGNPENCKKIIISNDINIDTYRIDMNFIENYIKEINRSNIVHKVNVQYFKGSKRIILQTHSDIACIDLVPPIIQNRIVSDYTFATRFNQFLEGIEVNDPMSQEELDYFKHVAKKLLELQKQTAVNQEEIKYLNQFKDQ